MLFIYLKQVLNYIAQAGQASSTFLPQPLHLYSASTLSC